MLAGGSPSNHARSQSKRLSSWSRQKVSKRCRWSIGPMAAVCANSGRCLAHQSCGLSVWLSGSA